ncbi:MAG TPA: ATP-binding protein [Sphingomonas sp.]|nr:ATP-binding protein [Sphingomonas sp.]
MPSHNAQDRVHSIESQFVQGRLATAAAAHDLCNHLQVISSALHIIERSVDASGPSGIDVVLGGARSSLERAGRLCRSIVDPARSARRVRRRTCIGERLAALREVVLLAGGPGTLVEYAVRDNVPDVFCAAEDLDDAILNIVVNAGRAMPVGGTISVTVSREDVPSAPLPFAVLRISDTGCGMVPDVAARAFEPRFTTRGDDEGSGVGLAMVADFARSVGGTAELESSVDVGTVVTIRLPGLLKRACARRSG